SLTKFSKWKTPLPGGQARRNKLLVSWGLLVIAAPLAGSLLAPLRCAAPCQSRSRTTSPRFIFKIQKGGAGVGAAIPSPRVQRCNGGSRRTGLRPTADPSLLLRPHHQCPPVTYVTGDLAGGALP